MYVSLRRYHGLKSASAFCREIELSFLPDLERLPGFISYHAVDAGAGSLFTVSVFSTEAMAQESTRLAADWLGAHFASWGLSEPEVVSGSAAIAVSAR